MFNRAIVHRYVDPVDLIWLRAAADLGLTIRRSAEAFAAYDGEGNLTIAEEADFDADDCLAQMIFHELCHWLVAGRRGNERADWGLSNVDERDLVYEYAAHRLQASLARPYGLRDFMAVTTDWRPYWDALGDDPLAEGNDPAIEIAREAAHLARLSPFREVIERSLAATAKIADAVRDLADDDSLWRLTRPRHRLGSLLNANPELKCETCAWSNQEGDDGRGERVCLQHSYDAQHRSIVDSDEPACERWEAVFTIDDCGSCGACCRQGFDLLSVDSDDPFRDSHPELIQIRDDGEFYVPRPNGICVALDGNGESSSYRCRHYSTRPQDCRDFEVGGEACLLARRRVGISH